MTSRIQLGIGLLSPLGRPRVTAARSDFPEMTSAALARPEQAGIGQDMLALPPLDEEL